MFTIRRFLTLSLILSFGLLIGCGGGGGQQTQPADQSGTQTKAAPSGTGGINVTVNFEGTAPEPTTADASGNPECATDQITMYPVKVNDNGTLKNTVVAVKSGPSGLDAEAQSVKIDQQKCQYVPRVIAAKAGQTIKVHDSDEGLHNVRATQDGRQIFNLSTFKGGTKDASFDEAGVYSLECNVHPWMQGWVYVTEHGRAAVTGDSGKATLSDLPVGDYEIVTWHEKYGTKTQSISVKKGQTTSLNVTYSSS